MAKQISKAFPRISKAFLPRINYNKAYFEDRDYLDQLVAQSLQIILKENNLKSLLDVGCGTGRLVKFFRKKGFTVYGCDTADEAIKMARKNNGRNTIKEAQATRLPFKQQSFDIVSAISLIEHLSKKEARAFLLDTSRVLRPHGFVFLITPNYSSPFRYLFGKKWFAYKDPTHINFFTPKSIKLLLTKCGFKNVKFRHKSAYNVPFDWYLPSALRKLPMPFKNLLNYLMVSSPLSTFRDSIWVSAEK